MEYGQQKLVQKQKQQAGPGLVFLLKAVHLPWVK
jgi:hypothetical protein